MPFSGVDERSFVLLFAIGVVIAAAVAQVWRILALSHSGVLVPPSIALRPVEAAYLSGGRRLAFTVAVATLRSFELDKPTLAANAPHTEEVDFEQDSPLGPIERAILQLSDSALNMQRAAADRRLRQAYRTVAAELEQRGLLLTNRQRIVIGMAALPLAIVTGCGVVRLAYRPDAALVFAVLAAALIMVGLLLRVPRGTWLGMTLTRTPEAGMWAECDLPRAALAP